MGRRAELIDEIGEHMGAARLAARLHGLRHLVGSSVSLPHLHVLSVLRADGPLPLTDLARQLDVSPPGATGIVSRMEKRGLVVRVRSETDRRVVRVSLASGGKEALAHVEGRAREHFRELLGRLSTAELESLRVGLQGLQRARTELTQEARSGQARKQTEATA